MTDTTGMTTYSYDEPYLLTDLTYAMQTFRATTAILMVGRDGIVGIVRLLHPRRMRARRESPRRAAPHSPQDSATWLVRVR